MAAEKSKVKTSTGLDRNAAAALSYVLGPITGVIFFILENFQVQKFGKIRVLLTKLNKHLN